MIFWDTSAVVPLLVEEPASASAGKLLERDPAMLVWWGTAVECRSALARRERDATLPPESVDAAAARLRILEDVWSEVLASEAVRDHAVRLLRVHELRAADAFQLAGALTWARGRPASHPFATLDQRLGRAARAEGFAVELIGG